MAENNLTNKKISILIGDDESKLYEYIMKGLSMRANQLGVSLLFYTGCRVPSFCTDLITETIENDRDYQFSSIYGYEAFSGTDGLIVIYNLMKGADKIPTLEDVEKMAASRPAIFLEVEPEDVDLAYALAKSAVDDICKMIDEGSEESIHLSADPTKRKKTLMHDDAEAESDDFKGDLRKKNVELMRENIRLKTQAWFISFLTRDLIEADLSIEEYFKLLLNKMCIMGIRNAHFFLIKDQKAYEREDEFELPHDMLYVGGIFDNGLKAYEWAKWRDLRVSKSKGFMDYLPDKVCQYQTFVLFSGEVQYGVLVVQLTDSELDYILSLSLQLGNIIRFIYLKQEQRQISAEMERSLDRIKETNQILSVISRYDELTKILNRRGFMEQSLAAISRMQGKKAYILFADLDHLKEINDSFGHADGDFAITTAANILKSAMPRDGFCARMGGDEFVAFIPSHDYDTEREVGTLKSKIKDATFAFNITCDKPYFIELSIGCNTFECSDDVDFAKMISMSDELLYEDKQKRRASIKKNI